MTKTELYATAMQRIVKARVRLTLERKFYGVLVSNVEPVISEKFPTAATNGRVHYWNPNYVMGLTDDEILFVQAHESEHDARHHSTRRGGRLPLEWNEAADYSINPDLVAEGFTPPKGILLDPKYAGMASEDIYRMRELEQRDAPQPPKPEQGDDDGDDGEQPGDDADTNESQTGGDAGETDDGDDEGEGAGGDAGEGADGEGEGQGGKGGDAGDDTGTGQGSGDVGGCGEVLDSTDDATEAAEEDVKWERVVRQAASMAKAAGQLPGHVAREIERANSPPRNWRDELREFAEQGNLRIETWNRPNKRHTGRGYYLPSTVKDGISKAAFLIDTSGSCDDIALAAVSQHAQQMLDDGIIDQAVVVYGDEVVTRVDEFSTGDDMGFDAKGGGGTDMKPLFDFVAEQHPDASMIVCFTDCEFYRPLGDEPSVPVMFALHGYPQSVQHHLANTPWGARSIDVGTH